MSDLAFMLKQVDLADKLAEVAHVPQKRWDGTPYIEHPRAVAQRAFRAAVDSCVPDSMCLAVKIVGLLHDVVEDTPITPAFISRTFGQPISKSVLILTRPRAGDMGEEMSVYYYDVQLAHASWIEILVKLADVWHNAQTPAADGRRAIAWCHKSAYRTLGIVRQWLETNSGALASDQLLEQVDRLYAEAHEAVDALLAVSKAKSGLNPV
jgi:(p)ppGpp synthase/HD superfamily hydrolase